MKWCKLFLVLSFTFLISCQNHVFLSVSIENTTDKTRDAETIEIDLSEIKISKDINVIDQSTGEVLLHQLVDMNQDNKPDFLLFQPHLEPNQKKTIHVVLAVKDTMTNPIQCYSRFVPERIDDYTWENDKVAFRVYGPTAQKLMEEGQPGGTLSSGVDAWLKRVSYPIINKWYKETTEGTGSYHEDTGEGLDNFHVGVSSGVGGMAIVKDSLIYTSKNYTKYTTLSNGPIRTVFKLDYADWNAGEDKVYETKVISLDRGQFLSKFDIAIEGVNEIETGLTLHEKDGHISSNTNEGWLSYWQPHADSELGSAIVASPSNMLNTFELISEVKDKSHAFATHKISNNNLVYYAGFGWKKQGTFKTEKEWQNYLSDFSFKLSNPIIVKMID